MEEGEGEGGPGKLTGGTGLGDGEGQKDVSERIENQVLPTCTMLKRARYTVNMMVFLICRLATGFN